MAVRTTQSDDAASAQFRAVLAGLGWTPDPPDGQGVVRERWESWSALASLADDFCAAHPDASLADLNDCLLYTSRCV